MASIILLGKQQKYIFHWWQDPLRACANKQTWMLEVTGLSCQTCSGLNQQENDGHDKQRRHRIGCSSLNRSCTVWWNSRQRPANAYSSLPTLRIKTRTGLTNWSGLFRTVLFSILDLKNKQTKNRTRRNTLDFAFILPEDASDYLAVGFTFTPQVRREVSCHGENDHQPGDPGCQRTDTERSVPERGAMPAPGRWPHSVWSQAPCWEEGLRTPGCRSLFTQHSAIRSSGSSSFLNLPSDDKSRAPLHPSQQNMKPQSSEPLPPT